MENAELVERWESRGGASWVDIYHEGDGEYAYLSSSGGGYAGRNLDDLYKRIRRGDFQPDANVTPMTKVVG